LGRALFYHLTRSSVEEVAQQLLERSLAAGWRVELRGVDPGRMDWLDQRLWQGRPESFLPHGRAGGAADALQPVLLTHVGQAAANGPRAVMTVEGAAVTVPEIAAMERVWILFDGHDGEALSQARGQWKALTDAGAAAEYWSEDSGKWEKKAEKTAG
jgi:DNA polymerase III subunit chi